MVVQKRRVVLGVSGILALEAGTVAAAAAAWGMAGLISALIAALVFWDLPVGALLDRYTLPANGPEALRGQRGEVAAAGYPESGLGQGWVRLGGDLWAARSASAATPLPPPGTPVRVRAVEGLVLLVEPEVAPPGSSRR